MTAAKPDPTMADPVMVRRLVRYQLAATVLLVVVVALILFTDLPVWLLVLVLLLCSGLGALWVLSARNASRR